MKSSFLTATVLAALALSGQASAVDLCANADDAKVIQHYYANRPGAPLPPAARLFHIPEATVASALKTDEAYGVRSNRQFFEKVWQSIDTWGTDTRVGLVLTSGGQHAFNFPSKVPQTQATASQIWYDIYADGGKGVHGHITPNEVEQIWAVQLPTAEKGKFTRMLNFYGTDGNLILGVYVSEGVKDFDPKAVEGFERTRELLKTQPRICVRD